MVLPKPQPSATKLTTRGQILDARKKGLITGWCVKIPKGRPPKSDKKLVEQRVATKRSAAACLPQVVSPSSATITIEPPAAKKAKASRMNFRKKEHFEILKQNVLQYIRPRVQEVVVSQPTDYPIRITTLRDNAPQFLALAKKYNIPVKDITIQQYFEERPSKCPPLLEPSEVEFLQEVIVNRDNSNNPMTRLEVIQLICEITQSYDHVTAKNHFDYLIREKKLNMLRRDGRVVTAQATTSKRGQITAEQQWRWHSTFDSVYLEMCRLNTTPPDGATTTTAVDFNDVCHHFVGNIDESCFQANADGNVKVIGSIRKRKTEANRDDCRASITSVRSGNAAGNQGPFIFLAKGKKNDMHPSLNPKNLESDPNMTPGSYIAMCESAYMTDQVWMEIVPKICAGIRKMPVVRDHPNWWCMYSFDGFGSHVNVHAAQKIFSQYKIFVMKEEGDTSQVNQAYDQLVAKDDKRLLKQYLIKIKKNLQLGMSQWHLIKIAAHAQRQVPKESWIKSFIRVNMHPQHRLDFEAWMNKLDRKGILESGKLFYDDNEFALYDAMPAFWRRMPTQTRQAFVHDIDAMYIEVEDGETVWSPKNLRSLLMYVPLDELQKARACYLAAKKDDKVIHTTDEDYRVKLQQLRDKEEEEGNNTTVDNYFSFRPSRLLTAFLLAKTSKSPTQQELTSISPEASALFKHMCNYAAQMNWSNDTGLMPSDALDVHMNDDQRALFNPTYKNVLQGFIMYDVKGSGAKKKLAKRKLDVFEGNVASYSRCLNDDTRMEAMKDFNQLVASVAVICAETEEDKKKKREAAAAKAIQKKAKKQRVIDTYKATRDAKLPLLRDLMKARLEGHDSSKSMKENIEKYFATLSKGKLQDIIKYYYEQKLPGVNQMSKENLVGELWLLEDE